MINKVWQALIASSIVFGAFTMPIHANARGWQQWVQQGASIVRRGAQYRNEAAGQSEGSYHQATPQPPQPLPAPSQSPGSNYYNIDPATMRHPLKHADPEPAQEQPAYTPPQSRSYSSRSAYHTGSDDSSSAPQQTNMPASSRIHLHAHTTKHVERIERAVVVVPHKESTKPVVEKPEVLTPITAFDTSWITPTLDRIEAKLRKGLN